MDFNKLPDLDNVEVIDEELNPLAYGPGDYPTILDMLHSPQFNSDVIAPIDLLALSKNGVLVKDSMEKYLANKSNSSSALKEALKTPRHYYFYMNQRPVQKPKKHFDLGEICHLAFLEPEIFDKYIIEPKESMASKEGVTNLIRFYEKLNCCENADLTGWGINMLKEHLRELQATCSYKVVEEESQVLIDIVHENYKRYGGGIISRILKGAISETSFYYKDPETGLKCKIRPDYFNIEENIGVNAIISYKTTSAQDIRKFFYDAAKYKYELSEGMYQEGASYTTERKFNVTIMIMLQVVEPYMVAVFWWDAEDLQNGKYKFRHAISTVKECTDKGIWPGFEAAAESGHSGIIEMKQPDWASKVLHPVDIDE
ncbi:hypothetical protein SAMN04488128_103211 [Chitinophaga eiseniae]|uniref:Putative exodeoxyribonuclease 8 PDDEXK-like domain-containing protein n=1 Tax=Chitinophaga eiseniae TaxID=634771 RepID=A0A1T4SPF9_9BACT|nr:PD-(D/E)XK nuclease-like domain-containing protein [Chitinophaga eiseniae]SKA30046.1 hypothetical protein SAMN04488128_103211 [Chitinophaga eiseniae]